MFLNAIVMKTDIELFYNNLTFHIVITVIFDLKFQRTAICKLNLEKTAH